MTNLRAKMLNSVGFAWSSNGSCKLKNICSSQTNHKSTVKTYNKKTDSVANPVTPDRCSSFSCVQSLVIPPMETFSSGITTLKTGEVFLNEVNPSSEHSTLPEKILSGPPVSIKQGAPLALSEKWKCDVCGTAIFETSSEAWRHALTCSHTKKS